MEEADVTRITSGNALSNGLRLTLPVTILHGEVGVIDRLREREHELAIRPAAVIIGQRVVDVRVHPCDRDAGVDGVGVKAGVAHVRGGGGDLLVAVDVVRDGVVGVRPRMRGDECGDDCGHELLHLDLLLPDAITNSLAFQQ
jgi:hypothetical protein